MSDENLLFEEWLRGGADPTVENRSILVVPKHRGEVSVVAELLVGQARYATIHAVHLASLLAAGLGEAWTNMRKVPDVNACLQAWLFEKGEDGSDHWFTSGRGLLLRTGSKEQAPDRMRACAWVSTIDRVLCGTGAVSLHVALRGVANHLRALAGVGPFS